MTRHLWGAAAAAFLVTAAACGGSAPSQPAAKASPAAVNTCAKAKSSPHVAYLVVQLLSGQAIERCAGFATDAISGTDVMRDTGIQYTTQVVGSATVVCQLDNQPPQVTDCGSAGQPHWQLWVESGGAWTAATTGFDQVQLHDKDGLGWRYVLADASPAPPPLPRPA